MAKNPVLLPIQPHRCIVLIKRDLQGFVLAACKVPENGLRKIDRVVVRLRPETQLMLAPGNLDRFRFRTMHIVKHDQALLRSSVQRTRQQQGSIQPDRKRRLLELMAYFQLDG